MTYRRSVSPCPVAHHCQQPTHCPYCIDGSEYVPDAARVPHPAQVAARQARQAARRGARQTAAAQTGRRSVRKGRRVERAAVQYFGGERVPLSGMLDGHPNDTVLPNGWRAEVKARHDGLGWLIARIAETPVVAVQTPDGPSLIAVAGAVFRVGPPAVPEPYRADPLTWPPTARVTRKRVKQLWDWLTAEQADVLLIKIDRQPWLVVMDVAHWRQWTSG